MRNKDEIGDRIQNLRRRNGFTQKKLGEIIGGNEKSFQSYEYGKARPTIEQFILLANLLDTSIEYIVNGNHNDNQYELEAMPFHKCLTELRKNHKMTQKEVAMYLEIDEAAYQRYEYGKNEPRLKRVKKLADLFQVPIDDMMGRVQK